MGLISRIFGSDKIIDAGISTIDKAFYTEQEKEEALTKRMTMKAMLLKAYEPFKVCQRLLAMIYGIPYATAWAVTYAASFYRDVETQINILSNSDFGLANMIVLGFYFGGGAAESIFKWRSSAK